MMPSFLITLREVLEATLIVATIVGILTKLNQKTEINTVYIAAGAAGVASFILIAAASILGFKIQELYVGKIEQITEGILLAVSAVFITWAVFFLHHYFGSYKTKLILTLKNRVEKQEQRGLFILVFTAVFREGFEIVLFLSTIYLSSRPLEILAGFTGGLVTALCLSLALFSATIRLRVYYAFRFTSALLILFAAGMLTRGIHEFTEAGFIPEISAISLFFIPKNPEIIGTIIKSLFGLSRSMDVAQIGIYTLYVVGMSWWVFVRKNTKHAS